MLIQNIGIKISAHGNDQHSHTVANEMATLKLKKPGKRQRFISSESELHELEGAMRQRVLSIWNLVLVAMITLALAQCNSRENESRNQHMLTDANEHERYELKQELIRLRKDIDRKIEIVDDRIENASGKTREELRGADRKLQSNRAKVNKAIEDVERATNSSWNNVKLSAHNTTQDVKSAYQELAYEIDNLFSEEN